MWEAIWMHAQADRAPRCTRRRRRTQRCPLLLACPQARTASLPPWRCTWRTRRGGCLWTSAPTRCTSPWLSNRWSCRRAPAAGPTWLRAPAACRLAGHASVLGWLAAGCCCHHHSRWRACGPRLHTPPPTPSALPSPLRLSRARRRPSWLTSPARPGLPRSWLAGRPRWWCWTTTKPRRQVGWGVLPVLRRCPVAAGIQSKLCHPTDGLDALLDRCPGIARMQS